jgi:hypothetical protein
MTPGASSSARTGAARRRSGSLDLARSPWRPRAPSRRAACDSRRSTRPEVRSAGRSGWNRARRRCSRRTGILLADRAHAALVAHAAEDGVEIRETAPVRSLSLERRAVRVQLDGDEIRARSVVVAAGAWAPRLLAGVGVELPVVPTRETVVYLDLPGAEAVPSVIDYARMPAPGTEGVLRTGQAAYALVSRRRLPRASPFRPGGHPTSSRFPTTAASWVTVGYERHEGPATSAAWNVPLPNTADEASCSSATAASSWAPPAPATGSSSLRSWDAHWRHSRAKRRPEFRTTAGHDGAHDDQASRLAGHPGRAGAARRGRRRRRRRRDVDGRAGARDDDARRLLPPRREGLPGQPHGRRDTGGRARGARAAPRRTDDRGARRRSRQRDSGRDDAPRRLGRRRRRDRRSLRRLSTTAAGAPRCSAVLPR